MSRTGLARAAVMAVLILTPGLTLAQTPDDNSLAKELPRIKPLDPVSALASFQVVPGFRLEAVATEPLVSDPVSVCYDADGRLFVAEMRGYPYPEKSPTGFIRRLEDKDGDGKFDHSRVFLDGLSWPTSVVPYDGGVFIAVAPDILYAKDTDGDGVADVRQVVFTGFGTGNVQALLNGLLWGPDGWIYGVSGGNGGDIRSPRRPGMKPVSVRGRDFRFKPDGSAFEAISGGGQFGHAFDDWGHRFTCNNSDHIRQVVLPSHALERNPALVTDGVLASIADEGAAAPVFRVSPAEPWRIVRTRQRAADPLMAKKLPPTELVAIGFFTSATGVTIYRGDAFPPAFRGNAFIGDVGGNLVHRKALTKSGSTFRATRTEPGREFLASPDNWFRPVNFANTPDGTLLILDMYRETIEHPFSIPEPIKTHLDLTSGKDLGRLYDLVPTNGHPRRRPRLSAATTNDLVRHLADPAGWWRETAQRLLIERNDPAAWPLLRETARHGPTPLAKAHAVWTLDALGTLTGDDLLPLFSDADANLREQAARLADGKLGDGSSLIEPLRGLADDPDPMVRFATALSLGTLAGDRAVESLAAIARRDAGDRWTRLAVLSSLAHRPLAMIERLNAHGFFDTPDGLAWLSALAGLVGTENEPAAIDALLRQLGGKDVSVEVAQTALLGLGRGLQRSGGSLRTVLAGDAGKTLAPLFADANRTASSDATPDRRVAAVRLLTLGSIDASLETLPTLIDARQPAAVQLAAIQGLAGLNDRRVAPLLLERWKALGPSVRREALEALFARPERLNALLDAIEAKTLAAGEIDPVRARQLLGHPDRSLRDRARHLLAASTPSDRVKAIEARRGVVSLKGNPGAGREVFARTCATCHQAGGQGVEVGPDLATVAGRSPEDLLVPILDPNREVAPNYLNYGVETTEGRLFTGLIASESANSVTLKRAEGATDEVPRNRIESIASTGVSLMPEGLDKGLSDQDLADLIAFVRALQPAGPRR